MSLEDSKTPDEITESLVSPIPIVGERKTTTRKELWSWYAYVRLANMFIWMLSEKTDNAPFSFPSLPSLCRPLLLLLTSTLEIRAWVRSTLQYRHGKTSCTNRAGILLSLGERRHVVLGDVVSTLTGVIDRVRHPSFLQLKLIN